MGLTSEVIKGHWRSKTSNGGQALKTRPRDAFFCIYTHMMLEKLIDYVRLALEVITGQTLNYEVIFA